MTLQSPLSSQAKAKPLNIKDYDMIKHYFIETYGYKMWTEVPLDELFEMLPFLFKEVAKKENLRICSLKFYGVKNPK